MAPRSRRGFTLLELMIVVAIIGVLASIFAPKMAGTIRAANERATLSKLGSIRKALGIYYTNNEGRYPSNLDPLLQPGSKYLTQVVPLYTTAHGNNSSVDVRAAFDPAIDTGSLGYVNADSDPGRLWVECTHTDFAGKVWTQY